MHIIHFKTLPSTQLYARESTFNDHTLIKTKYQTSGIGQRGNVWQDACGNFSGTFVFKNVVDNLQNMAHFSVIIAVGCARYFKSLGFSNFSLKWPNDIYDKNATKKMGGILCEINESDLLTGIGLNLYHTPYESATSFTQEGAILHYFSSRDFFLCLNNTLKDYNLDGFKTICTEWLSNCGHIDKYIEFSDGTFGIFKTLNQDGRALFW